MQVRLWGRVFLLSKKKCIFLLLLLLVVCAIIGYALIVYNKPSGSVSDSDKPENTILFIPKATLCPTPYQSNEAETRYAIHLTGCIVNPGVIYVAPGEILYDAIILAGGFTDDADTEAANLAMKISDGMQIRIPSKKDTDKTWLISPGISGNHSDPPDADQGENSKMVNINTASVAQLMTLSGIGASTAKSIISYREEKGPFLRIEDIMNVPGIKEGKYNKIKDDICISS